VAQYLKFFEASFKVEDFSLSFRSSVLRVRTEYDSGYISPSIAASSIL
jgi:hypothetical protein